MTNCAITVPEPNTYVHNTHKKFNNLISSTKLESCQTRWMPNQGETLECVASAVAFFFAEGLEANFIPGIEYLGAVIFGKWNPKHRMYHKAHFMRIFILLCGVRGIVWAQGPDDDFRPDLKIPYPQTSGGDNLINLAGAGLVTNTILICWLFKIKAQSK